MKNLHPWDVTPEQARAIQEQLREQLIRQDDCGRIRTIAGLDIGFEQEGKTTRAAVVVLSFPELRPLEQCLARCPTSFPYIPGLLSFRELPAALEALGRLRHKPDLLMCDGQGYAHPRRFGLACHLGLLTGLPSIGIAKSRLIGEHGPLGLEKGSRTWLRHQGEIIGALLRTRAKVKPVYVSVGHRIGLETALDHVLACAVRYRLPEPTHQAHNLASDKKGPEQ